MKSLTLIFIFTLCSFYFATALASDTAKQNQQSVTQTETMSATKPYIYDYSKINENIVAIVEPLIASQSIIRDLKVEIDPSQTDIAKNKVQVNFDVVLDQTPWSGGPCNSNTTLGFQYVEASENKPSYYKFTMATKTTTDAIALTRFKAKEVYKKYCINKYDDFGHLEVHRAELCQAYYAMQSANSVKDISQSMKQFFSSAIKKSQSLVVGLQSMVALVSNPQVSEELQRSLKEAKAMLKFLKSVSIHSSKDSFVIHMKDFHNKGIYTKNLIIRLSSNEFSMETDMKTSMGAELYVFIKPHIEQALRDLQQGNQRATEHIQSDFNALMNALSSEMDR